MCLVVLILVLSPLGGAREPSHPGYKPNAGGRPTNSTLPFSANKKHMWGSLLPQGEKQNSVKVVGTWVPDAGEASIESLGAASYNIFFNFTIKKLSCQKSFQSAASLRMHTGPDRITASQFWLQTASKSCSHACVFSVVSFTSDGPSSPPPSPHPPAALLLASGCSPTGLHMFTVITHSAPGQSCEWSPQMFCRWGVGFPNIQTQRAHTHTSFVVAGEV